MGNGVKTVPQAFPTKTYKLNHETRKKHKANGETSNRTGPWKASAAVLLTARVSLPQTLFSKKIRTRCRSPNISLRTTMMNKIRVHSVQLPHPSAQLDNRAADNAPPSVLNISSISRASKHGSNACPTSFA